MIKEMEALTNPNVGAGFTSSTRFGQFHLGMGSFKNTRTQDLLEAHRDMSGADIT